jgi:AcrR family transcriptional regulator
MATNTDSETGEDVVGRVDPNDPGNSNRDDERGFARGEAPEAILNATIRVLETSGEASVRLASVADDAGVAIGLIGYHFGGREGLIEAAQAQRYSERSLADLDDIEATVSSATTAEDFAHLLSTVALEAMARASADDSRLRRVALLGSAFGRPDLREKYGAVQRELTDRYARVVSQAQDVGLIRADLDARAVAVFVQAYALGLVLGDIDPDGPDTEALTQVVMAAVSGLFASPQGD